MVLSTSKPQVEELRTGPLHGTFLSINASCSKLQLAVLLHRDASDTPEAWGIQRCWSAAAALTVRKIPLAANQFWQPQEKDTLYTLLGCSSLLPKLN